jgi:phage gp46-like protein
MARDIKMIWNENFLEGDFALNDGDLLREEGLTTAVLISLFSDARADEDDEIDDPNDKRGWWGDLVSETPIGSKLWQFERAKTTQTVIVKFKEAIENCLQWMIDDEVVEKIDVTVERNNNRLYFKILLYQSDGNKTAYKFDDLWRMEVQSNAV